METTDGIADGRRQDAPRRRPSPRRPRPPPRRRRPALSYDDDDDDDEPPARPRGSGRGRTGTATTVTMRDGANRGNAKAGRAVRPRLRRAASSPTQLKLKDGEEVVIRFLEDQPYASLRIHWLDRKGKRSYPCPGDPKKEVEANGCPFCAYSHQLQVRGTLQRRRADRGRSRSCGRCTPRHATGRRSRATTSPSTARCRASSTIFRRNGTRLRHRLHLRATCARPARSREDYPDLYVADRGRAGCADAVHHRAGQQGVRHARGDAKVAREMVSGEAKMRRLIRQCSSRRPTSYVS